MQNMVNIFTTFGKYNPLVRGQLYFKCFWDCFNTVKYVIKTVLCAGVLASWGYSAHSQRRRLNWQVQSSGVKQKEQCYPSAGRDLHRHGHCSGLVRGSVQGCHTDPDQRALWQALIFPPVSINQGETLWEPQTILNVFRRSMAIKKKQEFQQKLL